MDIKLLKEKIKTNTLDDSALILVYQDIPYVCHQYINNICKNKQLEKIQIEKLSDIINDDNLFDTKNSILFVYNIDKLDENIPEDIKNLVVICKQVVTHSVAANVVKIDKLLDWQIEDYVKIRLPGISHSQAKWLCDISKYNIYRLEKECDKLSIFTEELQQILFNQMNAENAYCDLNNLNIFNFTTAIVNKDYRIISEILENISYIDIEPVGVCSSLLKQYRALIDVKFSNQWNMSLSCSEKQFNYLKHNNANNYNADNLIEIYEKLTSIDYLLKSGYLPENYIIDYLLIAILSK